jgi:hypothetical protein
MSDTVGTETSNVVRLQGRRGDAVSIDPEDVKRWLVKQGWTLERLARALEYEVETVRSYLEGRATVQPLRRALVRFFRVGRTQLAAQAPEQLVHLESLRRVRELLEVAEHQRWLTVLVGPPGTGKTYSVRHLYERQEKDGRPFVLVTLLRHASLKDVLGAIARQLHVSQRGSAYELGERIVEALRRHPRLLVIDEAQHLKLTALEAVRGIHDLSGCGVVLSGSEELLERLQEADARGTGLAQLWSRVGLVKKLDYLTDEDAENFVRANLHRPMEPSTLRKLIELSGRRLRTLSKLCRLLSAGAREAMITIADLNVVKDLLLLGR